MVKPSNLIRDSYYIKHLNNNQIMLLQYMWYDGGSNYPYVFKIINGERNKYQTDDYGLQFLEEISYSKAKVLSI